MFRLKPKYTADFVLSGYGTGAVMAVPTHDQRDFEYAIAHNIPMIQVIEGRDVSKSAFEKDDYLGKGCKLINSEEFTGLTVEEAKEAITKKLVDKGIARVVNNYKMRDWVFGRQRFWGEPIPMIYCEKCGWQPMKEEDLPLLLPDVAEYEPTDNGESPLAKITDWVNTTCPCCGQPLELFVEANGSVAVRFYDIKDQAEVVEILKKNLQVHIRGFVNWLKYMK
mgnify:CR=1 FL=1